MALFSRIPNRLLCGSTFAAEQSARVSFQQHIQEMERKKRTPKICSELVCRKLISSFVRIASLENEVISRILSVHVHTLEHFV